MFVINKSNGMFQVIKEPGDIVIERFYTIEAAQGFCDKLKIGEHFGRIDEPLYPNINDNLTVSFNYTTYERPKMLIYRGDTAINVFKDEEAEELYKKLIGVIK